MCHRKLIYSKSVFSLFSEESQPVLVKEIRTLQRNATGAAFLNGCRNFITFSGIECLLSNISTTRKPSIIFNSTRSPNYCNKRPPII